MSDDEQRQPTRPGEAVRAPPADRRVIGPASGDEGAQAVRGGGEGFGVGLVGTHGPLVEHLPAHTQGLVGADVGGGDEPSSDTLMSRMTVPIGVSSLATTR